MLVPTTNGSVELQLTFSMPFNVGIVFPKSHVISDMVFFRLTNLLLILYFTLTY